MRELSPILAAFYKRPTSPSFGLAPKPAIEQYIAKYHEPVTKPSFKSTAYSADDQRF